MNVTIKEMAEKLRVFDEYMIVYHIQPDGDCIGSSYALTLALQSIGKKCQVVGRDPVPQIHRFMTDSELEGINSYVEQYEEMLIGVTVRELPDGRSRCSTRTSGNFSADQLQYLLQAIAYRADSTA